jgi:hypothetical protein
MHLRSRLPITITKIDCFFARNRDSKNKSRRGNGYSAPITRLTKINPFPYGYITADINQTNQKHNCKIVAPQPPRVEDLIVKIWQKVWQ